MDDLRDLPEHSQRAALRAAARRSRDKRAVAVLEAAQTQPNGTVTPTLAGDENRRALFLAEVGRRVMAKGSSLRALNTLSFLPSRASLVRSTRSHVAGDAAPDPLDSAVEQRT